MLYEIINQQISIPQYLEFFIRILSVSRWPAYAGASSAWNAVPV